MALDNIEVGGAFGTASGLSYCIFNFAGSLSVNTTANTFYTFGSSGAKSTGYAPLAA